MKSLVKRFVSTIKTSVIEEIKSYEKSKRKNIEFRLQELALNETANYVSQNMHGVVSVSTPFEVYDFVFTHQTLNEDQLFCEFGVWKGKSINYMAKKIKANIHGFDSFEGLPEYWRTGYEQGAFNLKDQLPSFEKNVVLHKGWFSDTLPTFVIEHKQPLALLHIDCDLYSSTKEIFKYLGSQIVEGTIIIMDEYFNYPFWQHHEFKAFHEFLKDSGLGYKYLCYNKLHEQVAVIITKK